MYNSSFGTIKTSVNATDCSTSEFQFCSTTLTFRELTEHYGKWLVRDLQKIKCVFLWNRKWHVWILSFVRISSGELVSYSDDCSFGINNISQTLKSSRNVFPRWVYSRIFQKGFLVLPVERARAHRPNSNDGSPPKLSPFALCVTFFSCSSTFFVLSFTVAHRDVK